MFGFMSKKDRKICNLNLMIKQRDRFIDRLVCEKRVYRAEIKRLEEVNKTYLNNIEFLTNNLTAAKKKQLGL